MSRVLTFALYNLLICIAYMSAWYLYGHRKHRLDVADIAWGGGFIAVVAADLIVSERTGNLILIAFLVFIWGQRLARHIARRHALQARQDPRYTELSAKWKGSFWTRAYFSIFLTQAVLIWIVVTSITIAASAETSRIGVITYIGAALWLVGFIFESVADRQLAAFIRDSDNKNKIMKRGLWRYSRHPNYFGEITQWWGIWLIVAGLPYGWLAIISPLMITFLILKVSGIPPLERRYQGNLEYQEYQRSTSVLIPLPPK